ncbi:unnamed protein product [Arabidopsis lyrata]|uniref:Uncharacterized protein n=1 Tax=Arabidopsis lyrata subsp. lyrata TaxID=81972 RepID=D7LSG9_ARALL|nr:hypothetical protein ARALYDRAFT_906209 [Arabidopsis lyrata subsp. lyrata]CAH8267990.1 unnamed protein product [Arabidopsis lyrata]
MVSLFDLYQCQNDRDHPKEIERCFRKFLGKPWTLEYFCYIEDPSNCFPFIYLEDCLKTCPPIGKGEAPSPPLGTTLPPL